jgi:hypothetical protein
MIASRRRHSTVRQIELPPLTPSPVDLSDYNLYLCTQFDIPKELYGKEIDKKKTFREECGQRVGMARHILYE